MRIESSYPLPIHGVSTLAPRNRMRGHAGAQVNFRSDPVNKLTRRPPLQWRRELLNNVTGDVLNHSYERDGNVYRLVLDKATGKVHTWVNAVPHAILQAPMDYIGDKMVAQTVEDKTYFVNRDKVVLMKPDTDESSIQKVSHLNITTALNYSETVKLNVTLPNGTRHSVTHVIPSLGIENPNYDAADAARATTYVASQLATKINEVSGISAVALGSSVAVWVTAKTDWLNIEIESGQGDRSIVAVNRQIESVAGLPLFAVVGTRIVVRPDPTSRDGTYYLEASRSADIPSGLDLEEVVWTEARSPYEPHSFDETTLPFAVEYDEGFVLQTSTFKARRAGDDESVKVPAFVGKVITNIGHFQKRLVLVSGNNVIMSNAEDYDTFWRKSAVQLLVTDAVSIGSSAVGIDTLQYVLPHNRDLLVIASNSQFKIGGTEGITPQTVSMALTTRYECQVNVPPVSIGNSVYLPMSYGSSTGIQEYTAQANTDQDQARAITHQVIGYMQGVATNLVASPNLEMLAMTTSESEDNKVFIYEQFTNDDGSKSQKSWSEWVFASEGTIIDLEFRNDTLAVIQRVGERIVIQEVRLYSKVAVSSEEIYLDNRVTLTTNGYTAELPTGYVMNGQVAIRGAGTLYELNRVNFTVSGNTLTFEEFIGEGVVLLGHEFRSEYRPTRPFKYDGNDMAVTTDRLRIAKFIVSLVETNEIRMDIISEFYQADTQVFNSRYLNSNINRVGSVPLYSGDYKFSFAQDARLAEALFYCDNYLGCTIAGISWEGQYHQSKGRM